jgi:hypothetical protein
MSGQLRDRAPVASEQSHLKTRLHRSLLIELLDRFSTTATVCRLLWRFVCDES